MSQAGPSRHRIDDIQDDDMAEDSQASQSQSSRRKRPRQSMTRKSLFAPEDLAGKARMAAKYRSLQAETDQLRADADNINAQQLVQLVNRQEDLFQDVHDAGLATLDARVMQTAAEAAVSYSRKLNVAGETFDIDELVNSIRDVLGLDRIAEDDLDMPEDEAEGEAMRQQARKGELGDWEKIGWMAAKRYRRVPGVEFLYGPLAVEHKKRTQRQRAQKTPVAALVEVDALKQTAGKKGDEGDMTQRNVISVARALGEMDSDGQGVNYFRLVVNPQSYAQTVENVFYASFLVREGKAGIFVKDDGEIMIRATEPPDVDDIDDHPHNQGVIELDMQVWKDAMEIFNITESAVPHRITEIHTLGANGWYS